LRCGGPISGLSSYNRGVGSHLQDYQYLGLDTFVEMNDGNNVDLSYLQQLGDQSAQNTTGTLGTGVLAGGDQYTGLDQFGQVIDQNWVNTSTGVSVDRFQYGYDADGNVLYDNNLIDQWLGEMFHADSTASGDNATAYDPLNRLVTFEQDN